MRGIVLRRIRRLCGCGGTFVYVEESSDGGGEGLDDGEEDEDADVVAEHPEHEHGHEDLGLGGSGYFEEFLGGTGGTLSMRSRRRGA